MTDRELLALALTNLRDSTLENRLALANTIEQHLAVKFDWKQRADSESWECLVEGHKLAVWPAHGKWFGAINSGASAASKTVLGAKAKLEAKIVAKLQKKAPK